MKRSLGRNWAAVAWAFAWLLPGSGAMAQVPEQHWQATPNYSQNNPPNYQPSTTPASPPATGNPVTGTPTAGQYSSPQQADQPVGPPPYPMIDLRRPGPAGQGTSGNQSPDNRATYPQGLAGQGQGVLGQPAVGQPIQGPPVRPVAPQAPFVLSPPEAAALDNLLADWEKRNKEIHVLESKFYRWKYDAVFGNVNQPPPPPDEGILKFAAPDKGQMKIDAKDPKQSEQWLCDGKSIYQFNYAENLVTEFVMPPELQGKGIGDGPLPFVFGIEAQKLKQRYFMRIITPRNVQNEVWLEAYPRYQQQAAEFSKVEVILQISGPTKALLPYAIQIYSPNGKDRIVYQLQNPSINPRIIFGGLGGILGDWWKPSIPRGWTKKTDLPPPPVQAGLSPSMSPRR
ncbi:MAG: TIGR03009 domain-containing protein [Thermoguttaceae bacterium]